MPRYTLLTWWCWKKHRNDGSARECVTCGSSRVERHAQVHCSERAVIYRHPLTGEHRTPPRADMPMPKVYSDQGFIREEILHMGAYERSTGVVHEASNFSPGNEPGLPEPPRPAVPAALREFLINDLREAAASGPWTSRETDAPAPSFTVPV